MALATKTSSSEPASLVIRPADARKTRAVASTSLCQREIISAGMGRSDPPSQTPATAAGFPRLPEGEPSRTAWRSPGPRISRVRWSPDLPWSPTGTPFRSADSPRAFARVSQRRPGETQPALASSTLFTEFTTPWTAHLRTRPEPRRHASSRTRPRNSGLTPQPDQDKSQVEARPFEGPQRRSLMTRGRVHE